MAAFIWTEATPEEPDGRVVNSSQQSPTELKVNALFLLPKESSETGSQIIEDTSKETPAIHPAASPVYWAPHGPPQPSTDYLEIMRAHYMKPILRALHKVQPYARTPDATVYINQILHRIREFDERSPDDPILEVLIALYDALAVGNLWTTYSETQYDRAGQILVRVVEEPVNPKNIEKAIVDLDKAGFDLLPFSFSDDDD